MLTITSWAQPKGVKRDIEKYPTCGCPKSILALSGALGPGQNCQIWWFENLGINFVPSELQVCTWERQLPGNPSSHERLCRLPQTCSTPPPVVNAQKTRQGFRPAATAQCKLSNSKFGILFQLFSNVSRYNLKENTLALGVMHKLHNRGWGGRGGSLQIITVLHKGIGGSSQMNTVVHVTWGCSGQWLQCTTNLGVSHQEYHFHRPKKIRFLF